MRVRVLVFVHVRERERERESERKCKERKGWVCETQTKGVCVCFSGIDKYMYMHIYKCIHTFVFVCVVSL